MRDQGDMLAARRERARVLISRILLLAESADAKLDHKYCQINRRRPRWLVEVVGCESEYLREIKRVNEAQLRLRKLERSLDKLLDSFDKGLPNECLSADIKLIIQPLRERVIGLRNGTIDPDLDPGQRCRSASQISRHLISRLREARALLEIRVYSDFDSYCASVLLPVTPKSGSDPLSS